MSKMSLIIAVGALCLPTVALAQQSGLPPTLDLLMTPNQSAGAVDSVGVRLTIENPQLKAGDDILKMPTYAVSIDVPAYPAAAIDARDDSGKLELVTKEGTPDPSMVYRRYAVTRATVGNVVVRYTGKPREVDATTRNGPIYDLRAEAGGLVGAGMYFLALPSEEKIYRVTVGWDLSHAPQGTRGVWSLGEGRQELTGTPQEVFESGFAIGKVRSVPADGKGAFGLYWLSDPPFDVAKMATELQSMYASMSAFFKDTGTSYRIFLERNPYPSDGGSGWTRAFVYGYGTGKINDEGQKMLLAHEMVHNWPRLDDVDLDSFAWYTEGTAEYYSAMLAYRNKKITLEQFAKVANELAEEYQTSPYVNASNREVGQKFWEDPRAQQVPYARGFIYLTQLNAQILAHSQGRRSVDDLVLEVLARQRSGTKVLVQNWRDMVVRELGERAGLEYDDMVAGKLIKLPASLLSPCLTLSQRQVLPFELGFDEMSRTVVRRLRAGSQAAAAGLAEGDRIVSIANFREAMERQDIPLSMLIEHDGKQRNVSYLPRRTPMEVGYWKLADGATLTCSAKEHHPSP